VAVALASTSLLSTSPVWAQPMAGALGKPLESPDLEPGTVSVRIVAGSPSKNVVGTEVTLLVDGTPRIARSGPDGRALFKDVKPGARLQAVVTGDDKKQITSDEFVLPGVGVKLMLSTLPWNPGASAGGGPPMAGAAGMPNPRQMSGQPRPEQTDPAGTFTVRLTYDDFKDAPPVGVAVALVGYHGDDTIDMQVVNSDAEGRSQFKGLDRSGATSYFAMALLPRDGKLERLTSTPAVLDARVGVRLILSGEKRNSNAPIVDDLSKFEKQDNAPPAGKVTISLEGGVELTAPVSLVELTPEGSRVFAQAKPEAGPGDPSQGSAQATFDLVPRPGQVFYAETRMHGLVYRSIPFQPVPDKGTRTTIFVYPRILFTFKLKSRVDDKYLAVNGRFEVSNNAWAPYVGGPDGLLLPLPKHFLGGLVAEQDQSDVALVPGEGFRLIRPLPPGSRPFHGAFSLPVEDGAVSWRLDLPFGSYESFMEIMSVPGMLVQTPPGVNGQTATVPQGTFFVLPQISIMPKQSMVMSISGLPQPPAWKVWLPRIFGILVVLMLLGGVTVALLSKRGVDADKHARRQKLLDELVELERSQAKGSAKRREQIMAELESLWDAA
jgi:hypothetical protein